MTARLLRIRIEGPDGVREVVGETNAPVWIGRDEGLTVSLDAKSISRRHASLEWTAEGLRIEDVSANGLLVEGDFLHQSARTFRADIVTLMVGPFRLQVFLVDPAGLAVSPPREERGRVDAAMRRQIHRQLLEQMDLAKLDRAKMEPDELRPKVVAALRRILSAVGTDFGASGGRDSLVKELADEAVGLGPLEDLLNDPDVNEIMVVDPATIFVERYGKLVPTGLAFTDNDSVRAAIERIVTPLGRRIDESTPLVDARLKDGSRVNAVIPPLALRGPCITIRKFAKTPLRMKDLTGFGTLTLEMARFLERAVHVRKNIVISGGTGSGKTTLLNVLSGAIPERERIVTVEDAAELRLAQPHVVSLESRPANLEGKGEYSIRDLVRNALRMRPDRIVVGECRGGEALDMLQAMNTGHEGSLTTVHANTPFDAIARIETLCLMAGLDLPVRAIRHQIASSVHLIVQQSRLSDGTRRVTSIAEITGLEDDGEVELREIFGFTVMSTRADGTIEGEFEATGYLPSFLDQFIARGLATEGTVL